MVIIDRKVSVVHSAAHDQQTWLSIYICLRLATAGVNVSTLLNDWCYVRGRGWVKCYTTVLRTQIIKDRKIWPTLVAPGMDWYVRTPSTVSGWDDQPEAQRSVNHSNLDSIVH